MHGHAAHGSKLVCTDGSHDFGMGPHKPIMQFALSNCKRLLHHKADYAFSMDTPNSRLRAARIAARFETAVEAADAMGIPRATYIGHENGRRGFPASRAPQYARKFKVTEEWLLYGKGDAAPADPMPSAEELTEMLQEVVDDEVTVDTRVSDLPRIFGSALRERLERFATDPKLSDLGAARSARSKAAQSPAATKPGEQEESRNA